MTSRHIFNRDHRSEYKNEESSSGTNWKLSFHLGSAAALAAIAMKTFLAQKDLLAYDIGEQTIEEDQYNEQGIMDREHRYINMLYLLFIQIMYLFHNITSVVVF